MVSTLYVSHGTDPCILDVGEWEKKMDYGMMWRIDLVLVDPKTGLCSASANVPDI